MNSVEITVAQCDIKHNSNIRIQKVRWRLFPESYTKIELMTNGNGILRIFNSEYHEFALGEWLKAYQVKKETNLLPE